MNVHILLVMKYLDDNDSVTKQELLDNCKAAVYVADTAYEAYAADVSTATYTATTTAEAASDAAAATCAAVNFAKNRVDRYFIYTGENKQDYINEITKNK